MDIRKLKITMPKIFVNNTLLFWTFAPITPECRAVVSCDPKIDPILPVVVIIAGAINKIPKPSLDEEFKKYPDNIPIQRQKIMMGKFSCKILKNSDFIT